jgi:uncharacterized delta-60 repeat protein
MKKNIFIIVILILKINCIAQPGALDMSFNPGDIGNGNGDGANNSIKSTIIQNDGKIIITGNFTTYNGILVNRIARLNSNGTLDLSFNNNGIGSDGVIQCVKLQSDGKIIITGDFTSFNGIAINRIARLNNDGSIDSSFNPGSGADRIVHNFSIQSDGKIIIGGEFLNYNGVRRTRLARINNNGSLDTNFNIYENLQTNGGIRRGLQLLPIAYVYATSVKNNGDVLIGGDFSRYNDQTRVGLVNLYPDGSLDYTHSWTTTANVPGFIVKTISIQNDGKSIVAGNFTSFNQTPASFIIRFNTNGAVDSSFSVNTSINWIVNSSYIQNDGKIFIGGEFAKGVLKLNIDGTTDNTFNSGIGTNGNVNSIAVQDDGKIIITGDFTSYNGIGRGRIARINIDGSIDLTFNNGSGTNGIVQTTSIQNDGKIITGGDFTLHNGIVQNRLTRLNSDGTIDSLFDIGLGPNETVYDTEIQNDGKILVGGKFNNYRNYLLRINSDGSLDTTFSPTLNLINGHYVNKIATQTDGKIIFVGRFRLSNSSPPYRDWDNICRLNLNGTPDLSFSSVLIPNNNINSVAIQNDGKIIIGGSFTRIFNTTTIDNRITRLNSDGTQDLTFNVGTGANASINNLAIQSDGKILICGEFTQFNGINKNYLTRLNIDGSIDNTFNIGTGPNGFIYTILVQSNGKIILAGNFTSFNGSLISRIVRLNLDGTIDSTFNSGIGCNNIIYNTSIQPDGKIIIGGDFTSYDGIGRNRIARINADNNLDMQTVEKKIMVIYPNPVANLLQIQTPNDTSITSSKILNILGKVIIDQQTNSNTINTETLTKGLYILEVISGKDKFTSKFIKE